MKAVINAFCHTLRGIPDLYSTYGIILYVGSLNVLFWAFTLAGTIAAGFTMAAGYAADRPEIVGLGSHYPLSTWFTNQGFLALSQGLVILFLALYGIALVRVKESKEKMRSTPLWYASHITAGEWMVAGGCAVVLLAVQALLFDSPSVAGSVGGSILDMFNSLAYKLAWKDLLYKAMQFFKNLLLPVFLAALIVLYSIRGKIKLSFFREYGSAWFAALLLLFSINAVLAAANTLAQDLVLQLLIIPLMETFESIYELWIWGVGLLIFFCAWLIAAFFYPAFGLGFVLPFHYKEKMRAEEDGMNAAPIAET